MMPSWRRLLQRVGALALVSAPQTSPHLARAPQSNSGLSSALPSTIQAIMTLMRAARESALSHSEHVHSRLRGSGRTSGAFHSTLLCRERNVVRNTLADTPSGYIQDPRVAPTTMTRYDSISRVGAATLSTMEHEKALLEKAEVAFPGYTTVTIQERKRIVMTQGSTPAELQAAVEGLREDLATLSRVVGQEVARPLLQEHILLMKLQQRQQRLHDREEAFRVTPPSSPRYRVVLQADGSEVLERPGRDTPLGELAATDEAYLTQPVEMEVLPDSALVPETTVVTAHDVNHVRYVLGQGLRRLSQFEEAEAVLYSVLADDVTNVDAMEALLEMDLGIEGWEPRIRALLDFLVSEYDRAITEGRLQPPPKEADAGETTNGAGESEEVVVGASHGGNPSEAAAGENRDAATTAAPSPTTRLPSTPADALMRTSNTGAPYATIPQTAPLHVALSLLSDIIVEAAAHKCSADGEGATSRFFIESLGPIVRVLGRDYAPLLLEALFHAVDEQHLMVQFDSDDVSPTARALALSLVIAFLKALTARRIHEMLPNPVRFEYFTLSKLHAALRRAKRLHESYHISEKVMQLYRTNSAVYRMRRRGLGGAAATTSAGVDVGSLRHAVQQLPLHQQQQRVLPSAAAVAGSATEPETARAAASVVRICSEDAPRPLSDTAATAAVAVGEAAEPPDLLDDQDGDYREVFFQYVNDRAKDSPALGRRLCLEAMQEFPNSAAPWETLALLLHKENPEKNLRDAIIAARHAMLLEPLNLSVIATLANFYKAARRYELHDRMLDRYRLLVYMSEEGASVEDMLATAAEVESLDRETPEAQDLVVETGQEMEEYMFRMEQAHTYSMPIDKEPRIFREAPVRSFFEQADYRPPEVRATETLQKPDLSLSESPKPFR